MFDSGIKASELIKEIKEEVDIAIPVPDNSYISWLNSVEQLLYTELIKEQGRIELSKATEKTIDITTLKPSDAEAEISFEDIHAIYAGDTQLIFSTVASGKIFPNTYYKINNNIGLNLEFYPVSITIIYFVKPKLKDVGNYADLNVMVPVPFIDLVKAKLRGEVYKLVNEDGLAAKWINDYNILIETFKAWLSGKQSGFGI